MSVAPRPRTGKKDALAPYRPLIASRNPFAPTPGTPLDPVMSQKERTGVLSGDNPHMGDNAHKFSISNATPTERKEFPITTGVVDYFMDALMEVAKVSYTGNQQHNPGQPMHWARAKSTDHENCIGRHLAQRGSLDTDGMRHSAKLAWRALALLQEELERDLGVSPPRACK